MMMQARWRRWWCCKQAREAPYGAANNTRDSAAGPNRAAGVPYKDPDLPYPPIQGRWEASLPEKTWEECTLLPKKHHTAHCSEKIVTLKKAPHSTLHTSKKAPKFFSYLNCFMQNSSDLSSFILCVVDFHVRMAKISLEELWFKCGLWYYWLEVGLRAEYKPPCAIFQYCRNTLLGFYIP